MHKTELQHAVVKEDGVIKEVGRTAIFVPKPNFGGGKIKWFDDTQLIRKNNDK